MIRSSDVLEEAIIQAKYSVSQKAKSWIEYFPFNAS